jgi:hypothetical protein
MISPEFTFDEALHAYAVDNNVQPHVTGILQRYGIIDYSGAPADRLERKTILGQIIHKATHYRDEDRISIELALAQVVDRYAEQMRALGIYPEELCGYASAWMEFLRQSDFECFEGYCERRHIATVNGMRYGMTIDRAGMLTIEKRRRPTILDLKCTAAREKSWPIQLAGYALGLPKPSKVVRWERAAIWLKPEGDYAVCPGGRNKFDRDEERRDEEVFLAALRITHWKRENLGHE